MKYELHYTTDPSAIADLHVLELAEQGKNCSSDEVIKMWLSVSDRHFITAGNVGFIAFQSANPHSCYLSDLYVELAVRGQGLGRDLIRAVKKRYVSIELHVDQANGAAYL